MHGGELIAQARGSFKGFLFGCGEHACVQRAFELGVTAFEKKLRVAHCLGVDLRGRKAFDAGAETAMNVVLQTCARMEARKVDLAAWKQETAMDQFGDAVGKI